MIRVLFVCMGNICRSPTAEGVFRKLAADAGLEHEIEIDSAGTHDYHIGYSPDERAQAAAHARGYDLFALRARRVTRDDFRVFDYVLAMDRNNLTALQRLCPPQYAGRVKLFMHYARNVKADEVPDPYYGGPQGFEHALDMIEDAARGLLEQLQAEQGRSRANSQLM
ncbi:MAG TPA: low molecular weight protein-tyrosine-phosphatase [Burkholderiales bacterium]|nr:low molecular weight protein-tyrosine-phosphatase [Burkholderiales bacterium]